MTIRAMSYPIPLVLAAALLAACAKKDAAAAGEERIQPTVGARIAVAQVRPFSETVAAIGTVSPRAGHVAALSAPGPTRVTQVLVAAGDHVARGQPLVILDRTTFQAALQSAEARLVTAERAYERARRLSAEGIIPRKDLDQAQAELAVARADVATARRALELSVLRSPISGVVTRVSAVLGASADANAPLVELADPTALDFVLGVTATDAGRVRVGDPVTLTAGQSARGERLGVGSVVDVAGALDTASRSVPIRVRAPGTRRPLRIGETVYGEIAVATHPRAIVIPAEALVPEGEEYKVFVVDDRGIAHSRPVRVGARADSLAEITEGLRAGERIVTYGAYGVEDSVRVVPMNAASGARK